ncbi:FAD-dependent monooxygenase [Pseudokineococcus lusitanus]|uniref:FAD-dependent urate hydroxylase n=1 Tax=Pseudokineococcus lusitanus TaxID=763993 RepID=A0A3N1HTA7_9ACTN|nr:NAD(P)/FAD-dependent oxidoreductase [Pseudokineococcus lusitanus]ROP45755.1 FAD-dependent urate hydroxylase [Pseudokineococcus lusitanus]
MPPTSPRVVVVGAGVGGLAAAVALAAHGHEVRVVEEAPAVRAGGGAVTLWPGAVAVLAGLGVDVVPLGRPLTAMERHAADGSPQLRLDLARAARRAGSPVVTVPRGRLVEALAAAATEAGVVVRTGAGVAALTGRQGEGAGVALADGDVEVADVVVGADGARSAVRRVLHGDPIVLGPGTTWQPPPAPTGTAVDDGATCVLVVGPAGMVGLNPCGGGRTQVWWDVRTPLPGDDDPRAALRERFGGYRSPAARAALDLLDDPHLPLLPYPRAAYRVHRPWGRGAVTLLGDAAHAVPPSLAQGTNQALLDAAALARHLPHPDGPVAGLRAYEHDAGRRARVVSALSRAELTGRDAPTPLLRAVPGAAVRAGLGAWMRASGSRAS